MGDRRTSMERNADVPVERATGKGVAKPSQ